MKEHKSNYKLLYVEDEPEVRKNYVAHLSRYFDEVYEASSAEEALLVYKKQEPSILIIDIDLPHKSGIEFLQEIRQNDLSTKAIMLTAKSDVETLLNASELKLTKYLIKPVSRQELKDALALATSEIEKYSVVFNKIVNLKECYTWDVENQILKNGEFAINLTKKETALLVLLLSNTHKKFSSEEIIFELWYDADTPKEGSLKTLMKSLRKKLPPQSIKNSFGVGYQLEF